MTFTTINQGRVDVDRDGNRVNYMTTMNGKPFQHFGLTLEPQLTIFQVHLS